MTDYEPIDEESAGIILIDHLLESTDEGDPEGSLDADASYTHLQNNGYELVRILPRKGSYARIICDLLQDEHTCWVRLIDGQDCLISGWSGKGATFSGLTTEGINVRFGIDAIEYLNFKTPPRWFDR